MQIGVYTAALGSRTQQKRMEVISNNLANAGTPGFKKDIVRFENYLAQSTALDMEQGTVRSTGNPLDIALSGKGFLRVQGDQGTIYSRSGNLTLNGQGTLVTQEGWPVMGKSGPITINGATVRIEGDGQVFDDDVPVDTLDLVEFPPNTQLAKVKNGCFRPVDPNVAPVAATDCTVHQGSLEDANFNVVEQMAQMVDTLRVFEAYQKVLQSFDQMDAQLTNKLANP